MTDPMSARHDGDDARLLNLVRAGDSEAFGVLRERHEGAARRLARHLVASPYEVDDVVGEAFAWALDVTQRGGGPSNAVRPYVLTVLRRVCYYRLTGQTTWDHTDDRSLPEPGEPFIEPSMAGLETALMARAYLSLPDRWRAVLWHAQVEQARPADVAPLLGLTRNGVMALNRRAVDGLRQAYLQQHLSTSRTPECRLTGERLDHFVRDPHSTADAELVSAHLDSCDECRAIYTELSDVSGTLRAVVGPLILGSAAAAYLFGPGDATAAAGASGGRHVAQTALLGSAAAAGGLIAGSRTATALRALRRRLQRPWQPPWQRPWRRPRLAGGVAAGGAVAVAAAIVLTVALTSSPSTPTSANSPDHPAVGPPSTVQPTTPPPTVSPSPVSSSPAPAPEPPVTTALTASLAVSGEMFGASESLQFEVANNGSASTGTVTVWISLPAGSSAFGDESGGGGGGFGGAGGGFGGAGGDSHNGSADSATATTLGWGWTCRSTTGGAVCTHAPIAAGQTASDTLVVSLSGGAACGQPVSLTATSGSATAQATEDLACSAGVGG